MTPDFASPALLLWLCTAAGAAGTAVLRSRGRATPAARVERITEPVVLVRPCAGDELHLKENLLSTGDAVGASDVEIVFAVGDVSDAARPVALEVAAALRARGLDARVVVTTNAGPNRKSAQLAFVERSLGARPFAFVVVDSDVDLTGFDLAALVSPLERKRAAAATWATPIEVLGRAPSLGDRVSQSILGASLHSFPLLASLDARMLVGKTFAIRANALTAIGGFGAFLDVLGEDVEIARRLRENGEAIEVISAPVRARVCGRSLGDVVERYTRWLLVMRAQRAPLLVSYPLLFAAPLTISVAALASAAAWAATIVVLALLLRLIVGVAALRAASLPRGAFASALSLMLVGDAVLLVACARAVSSRQLSWRGRRLVIGHRGRLHDAARLRRTSRT